MSQRPLNLHELLSAAFSREELKTLYHDLDIDYDQPKSEAKNDLILYLILHCRRQGLLLKLVARCRELRAHLPWPDPADDELYETAILPLLKGYADEIIATYATFWNERVAFGGAHSRFLEEQRPLEGVFAYKSPQERKAEPANKPGDKAEEKDKKDDPKDDRAKDTSDRPTEELSSLQLAYASLWSQLPQGERGTITLLIGEPGGGKTLWLRYRATEIASDIVEPDAPVPIYLPLNTYRGEGDLESFIGSALVAQERLPFHRQLAAELASVMKRRPLFLLLDGLNEISETAAEGVSQKRRFMQALQVFVREHHAACLLATRETDFLANLSWPKVWLRPIDRLGVLRCLNNYAPADAANIYRLLDEKNLFGTLTSSPYRVRALCQIYKPSRGLPENAGALFEAFVATLVNREKEQRLGQGGRWEPFDRWAGQVGELARALTDAEATAIEAGRLPAQFHNSEAWSYAEGAGLLTFRNGRLQFSHQQLQEFFAARWLRMGLDAHGAQWEGFAAACRKRAWDQPLLLLAGIAEPELMDKLIAPLAAVDPFLACSCVGVDPERISASTRQWLAAYMGRGLAFAARKRDWTLLEEVTHATGEMRCAEGLSVLTQPEAEHARYESSAVYCRAVAQTNSADAADLLIAAAEEALTARPQARGPTVPEIVRALATMRQPEAQRFLARSLYDGRLYKEVLKVLTEVDTNVGYDRLRTLLTHNRFGHAEARDFYFDSLATAAARIAPRASRPDLLRHVDKPAAVQTLLQLGAGQRIIDEYVSRHNYRLRRQEWEADARIFGIQRYSFRRNTGELIDLRNCLYRDVGQKATGDFVDLLLLAAAHAQYNNQTPLAAAQALAIMRDSRALPVLRKLQAMEVPAEAEEWPGSRNTPIRQVDVLSRLINPTIEFLEEPRGLGIFNRTLDRFALALRSVGTTMDGETIPPAAEELLDWARDDPEQFGRFAVWVMESAPDWLRRDWGWGCNHEELLISAARYLAERGRPELPDMLLQLLVTAAEDEREYRAERIAAVGERLIEYGRRGPEQQRALTARLAPLVHRPNQPLQLAAVRALALLDANEYCPEWLEYLADRTWPLAYVIVDALGCMTLPAAVHELLLARLQSEAADERYFAVLALGSIGRGELLPPVLELGSDASVDVRRAVLWAVSQLGASQPAAVKVLADGLVSPHARLRREAANAIGVLRIRDLNRELRPLLADSALRVVERAAWALGRLGDKNSVPYLMNALRGVTYRDRWTHQSGLRQRVEYRLKETIAASLAQIRVGVNKDAVLAGLDQENWLLSAFVAGRLDEGIWDRDERRVPAYPEEPAEGEPAAGWPDLAAGSPKELERIADSAADPRLRKRALALLGQSVHDYTTFYQTIPTHDPLPEVQLEALRISARLSATYDRLHGFTGNPQYDLALTKELSETRPELALYIPLPEAWNADTALWLAQRFPDDYDLGPLLSRLIASLEQPHLPDIQQIRALCVLLERRRLVRYCLEGKISSRMRLEGDDWPPRGGDASWKPTIDFLLAQRRVWASVPRLLEELDKGEPWQSDMPWGSLQAIEALCEMGVYQAGDLIQATLRRLRSEKKVAVAVAVAEVMARVELSGGYGRKLPARFDDLGLPYTSDRPSFYIVSNILAESDCVEDLEEDLRLEAGLEQANDITDYADATWLDRRLGRWGLHHLRGFIQGLADTGFHRTIESVCDTLMPDNSRLRYGRADAIAQAVRRCPEALLAAWLEDESPAVRLVAFCGLGALGHAALEEHALRFVQDDNPQHLVALLRMAGPHRLPALFRFLQGETDLGLGSRNEQASRLLQRAVEHHLSGSDQDVKRDLISILRNHRTARFASALSDVALRDEPSTVEGALEALRWIGDRSQAAAIRPLLDAADPRVLQAAIETIAILRYRPAADRLLELLEHPSPDIQTACACACALLQIRRAIPRLRQRLLTLRSAPPDPNAAEDAHEATDSARREAEASMECALFLLHASPRLVVGDVTFTAGDGLLTRALLLSYRQGLFQSELPYPLTLLTIDVSQLIAHAIRRDLRAAAWANRELREMIPASVTLLFSEWPQEKRAGAAGDAGGWAAPDGGAAWANTWTAAIYDALASLERDMIANWRDIRAHWVTTITDVDLTTEPPDELWPDFLWALEKTLLVVAFDRLLLGKQDWGEKLPRFAEWLAEAFDDAGKNVLSGLDHLYPYGHLARLAGADDPAGETSVELSDDDRPLLAAMGESNRRLLVRCRDLARQYHIAALLAGWGCVVLRRLREQTSNPDLEAGYDDRVASYLWLSESMSQEPAMALGVARPTGEKVSPLASVGAPQP